LVAFPKVVVMGGERGLAKGRCSVVFRPRYLVVPRSIAPDFEIVGVRIGGNLQIYGEGTVPAACFSGDLEAYDGRRGSPGTFLEKVHLDVPLPLIFDVCRPSDEIVVEVLSLNMQTRYFHCVFYGSIVE
jgi:hypothetical protein